jgi:transposase
VRNANFGEGGLVVDVVPSWRRSRCGGCGRKASQYDRMPARLDNLRQIGIDEFSYRKRHRYLTIVVNHETRRVVWVGHGKSGQTLRDFFDQLEEERCQQIEMVTMDMAAGYIAGPGQRAASFRKRKANDIRSRVAPITDRAVSPSPN